MTSSFTVVNMADTYPVRNASGTIISRHYDYVTYGSQTDHISVYESGNYGTGSTKNTICDGFLFLSDSDAAALREIVRTANVSSIGIAFNVSGKNPGDYALAVGNSGFASFAEFQSAGIDDSRYRINTNRAVVMWDSGTSVTNIIMPAAFRTSFCSNPSQGIAVFSTRKTGNEFVINSSSAPVITVTYKYKASDFAANTDTVADIGSSITSRITIYDPTYTYKIRYRLTDNSYSSGILNVPVGDSSYTYSIPIAWCNAVPNALSTLVEITLWTQDNGTSIGVRQMTATLNVPASVVPTAGSLSYTASSGFTVPAGNLPLQINLSGQAGAYSSTISKYTITAEGQTSENSSLQLSTLANPAEGYSSRTMAVTATVIDSRGRSASVSTNFTVYAWDRPYFTAISVQRCDSTGAISTDGHYIRIEGTYACYPVNNENSFQRLATISIRSTVTGTVIDGGNLTSGTPKVVGGGNIASDEEYIVSLSLEDLAGTAVYSYNVYSIAYIMHFRNGGRGVAFGMASKVDNAVQINENWKLLIGNNIDVEAALQDLLDRVAALEGN